MAILTHGDLGNTVNAQPAGQVLAQVGGKPITEEDVTRFIQAMGRNGQAYNNPKGRAAVLEQMIAQRLFLLDAQRNLYEREPAFKAQLAAVKEQLLMEYAITKCIQSVRVTEEEVRAYYDAHKDDLQAEESVNASHILVDSEEKANSILRTSGQARSALRMPHGSIPPAPPASRAARWAILPAGRWFRNLTKPCSPCRRVS